MLKQKLKKGDTVCVIAGKDKGKSGEILKMFPLEGRALVSGINMVTKHQKATRTAASGIVKKETKIHVSNLAYSLNGVATKIALKTMEDGLKVRIAKKTGEVIANKN